MAGNRRNRSPSRKFEGRRRSAPVTQKLSAIRLLVAGYAVVVLIAAGLLSLPVSSARGEWQSPIDALFVASSGISGSGLSPVDIGAHYSLFGQIVLLVDFQIGGIGYMALFVYIMHLMGGRLAVHHQLVAAESMAAPGLRTLARFFRWVVAMTFFFEGIGALVLTCRWAGEFGLARAAFLGIFHAVSAFCTVGFSTFSDSLRTYQRDPVVNITIGGLCIVGAIGFVVLDDVRSWWGKWRRGERPRRLSTHSKLAFTFAATVIPLSTAVVYAWEKWPAAWTEGERLMAAAFQAVSASTSAGFSTLEIGVMSPNSLLVLMLLMFIGGSSGSTAGGVKTTTVGVVWTSLVAQLRRADPNLFRRRIPDGTVHRAHAILLACLLINVFNAMFLTTIQEGPPMKCVFEVVSALGNSGLSMGITPELTPAARVLLTLTMFVGRVGPLAIATALMARREAPRYRCADATIFVG